MSRKDREPQPDLEKKFSAVKDRIVSQLKARGGSPDVRLEQGGYESIRIASNEEEEEGNRALILHASGRWSGKSAMGGYDLGTPSLYELVQEYARIKDPKFIEIELSLLEARKTKKATEAESEAARQAYLTKNRTRLLEGLVGQMETVLGEIRGSTSS